MKKIEKVVSLVVAILIIFTIIQIDTHAEAEFDFNTETNTVVKYNGSLPVVTVPETINGKPVEHIGSGVFQNNTTITVVTLPNSLKTIDSSAFQGCINLNRVDFGGIITNLESIGDNAFQGCGSLTLIWTLRNHINLTVSANALETRNNNFLIMCSYKNETIDHISNLNGEYYRGIEEEALVINGSVTSLKPDFELGYLDVSNLTEVYQWAILTDQTLNFGGTTPNMTPLESGEVNPNISLYRLFEIPLGSRNSIQYDVVDWVDYNSGREVFATIDNGMYRINNQIRATDIGVTYNSQHVFLFVINNYLKEESYKIQNPIKTIYHEGESFDPNGLVVNAVNRLNEEVSFQYDPLNNDFLMELYRHPDMPCFQFNGVNTSSLKVGDTNVSFDLSMYSVEQGLSDYSYSGTIPITVLKAGLSKLEIKQKSTKLEYYEGESFDPTGLIFTGHYNNNTTQEIKYNNSNKNLFTFSTEPLTSGDKEIEITYDGHTVKQPITVKKVEPTHIEIKELPHQIEYYAGDKFNPEGLEITVHYNNGTSENIVYDENTKDKFEFSLDPLKDTDESIQITYLHKNVSVPITVQPLIVDTLSIKKPSTQLEYYEEDIFDPSGLILTVQYNSGKIEDIPYSEETKNDFIFSSKELTLDDTEINITYKNKTVKQLITVKERYTKDEIKKDNIIINGELDVHSTLTVEEVPKYEDNFSVIQNGEILGSYEVKLTGKYRGNLQLTFEVGTEHNGKTAYILHKKKDGSIEKFEVKVVDGKVIITVNELSPFIIYIDKEKTDINDNQEVLPPIIKPVIPIVPPISDIEQPIHQNDNLLENPNNEINVVKQPLPTHNNENNIPTGDHTTMVPYISTLGIGILGIGYYLFKRKQREKYGRK